MRLVLVHGFTQTGRSWAPVRSRFEGAGFEVMCPDLPGHGAAADVRADVATTAGSLATLGPATWVGYSMGGRVALHLAIDQPDAVDALVLVSTTAGLPDADERAERRRSDEELAQAIERDGVAPFVERWLSAPMWASLPRAQAGIAERLTNTAAGLAASLRLAGTGAQASLWDRLDAVTMPTLIVTGDLDRKFTDIGDRMAAVMPNTTRVRMADAGHAVPWERPDEFADAVMAWDGLDHG
jgi:2-succinyl-6-hydroxy-2,4-cyclohexadiene-1-carboxylate synthase